VIARPFDPVTGAPFPDQIGNVPWIQAADNGALDSADFQVDEAYFGTLPTWPMPPAGAAPVGCKTIFAGVVAEVDTAPPLAAITVNDYRYLMSLPMPRHAWQGQCRWTLFGPGCNTDGLNAATYAINGTVAAGSTGSTIIGAGLPVPQGSRTYKQGRIVMTSGLNNTFQRTIKDWDGAFTLSLLNPFPFMVAAGDTFVAYPGCNKARDSAQGCAGFGNQANHGGFDFIPPPEVQVG
jgi:hypothetical protein